MFVQVAAAATEAMLAACGTAGNRDLEPHIPALVGAESRNLPWTRFGTGWLQPSGLPAVLADSPRHPQHPSGTAVRAHHPLWYQRSTPAWHPTLFFALKVSCIARPAEVPDVIAKLSATTFVQVWFHFVLHC